MSDEFLPDEVVEAGARAICQAVVGENYHADWSGDREQWMTESRACLEAASREMLEGEVEPTNILRRVARVLDDIRGVVEELSGIVLIEALRMDAKEDKDG